MVLLPPSLLLALQLPLGCGGPTSETVPASDLAPAEPAPPSAESPPREQLPPAEQPPEDPGDPCPDGMVFIPAGSYTTGMQLPQPYAVVDTTKMEVVEFPERECPEAIASTPGASACWVQTDLHDPIVTEHEVSTQGFCMDRLPFPGAGPYPADGMTTWDAERFDELLSTGAFGSRRMCTFTEYELAVAGPTLNARYVYGSDPAPERCADREEEGIGSRASCRNPETGVSDYGAVISQWVLLDEQLVAWACQDPVHCRASGGARLDERREDGSFAVRYIVAGGTRRVQTRQAPYTPHTFHDHGQVTGSDGCDTWGWDDGPAVCASPDPRQRDCLKDPQSSACDLWQQEEAAWAELQTYCQGRRMTDCLNRGFLLATGEEGDVCPGSDGSLGPGQGR